MMVVMKRAQTFMSNHVESKSLRDCLDGQFAKLLQFILFHSDTSPSWCTIPFGWSIR